MADPPGSHIQNALPASMEQQLALLQQQQQIAQEQQRRLQEELRRLENQRYLDVQQMQQQQQQQPPLGGGGPNHLMMQQQQQQQLLPPSMPGGSSLPGLQQVQQQQGVGLGGMGSALNASSSMTGGMNNRGMAASTDHGMANGLYQFQQGRTLPPNSGGSGPENVIEIDDHQPCVATSMPPQPQELPPDVHRVASNGNQDHNTMANDTNAAGNYTNITAGTPFESALSDFLSGQSSGSTNNQPLPPPPQFMQPPEPPEPEPQQQQQPLPPPQPEEPPQAQQQSPQAPQQQQNQQQSFSLSLDNIQLLRTLQQLGVRLPPAAALPQDPLTALIASQLPCESEGKSNNNSSATNHTGAGGGFASGAASAAASNAKKDNNSDDDGPAIVVPTKKIDKLKKKAHKEDDDDAIYPIPDLPKERPLPPLEEGDTEHWSKRFIVPLAIEEDSNWLSERQCFIRAELLEVVRASHQDVLVRSSSKSVSYQQAGIRCRYCAHLHPSARAIRSSAFPSSIRQMYQSFTMMVRDHWIGCNAMPPHLKKRFMAYQEHKIPSSSLSREYWAYAADKIGMINTDYGITISEESLEKAKKLHSFGTTEKHVADMGVEGREKKMLVHASDQKTLSPYLFLLMNQVEECYLLESERVGKRKEAPVGLTGFGCQHCIRTGRLGFCRVFPLNKRSMPTKVNDIYHHLQRCPMAPKEIRNKLRELKRTTGKPGTQFNDRDREFVDQIWTKLGRKGSQIGASG